MYDRTLYPVRKHLCRYCLQAFNAAEILKRHIKDYFKSMPEKAKYVRFKNFERK